MIQTTRWTWYFSHNWKSFSLKSMIS